MEAIITDTVDQIWDVYDDDGNGILDKEETRNFLYDYLKMIGANEDEFNDEVFDQIYGQIDEDGSGEIDKEELIDLLYVLNQSKNLHS